MSKTQKRDAQLLGHLVVPTKPRLKGDDYPDVVEYAVAVTRSLDQCISSVRETRKLLIRTSVDIDNSATTERGGRRGGGRTPSDKR